MNKLQDGRGAKQVIILRKDLKMNAGKAVAQGAHASLASSLTNFFKDNIKDILPKVGTYNYEIEHSSEAIHYWLTNRFVKICLAVNSELELMDYYNKAKEKGLPCSLIQDAGFTQFNGVPTYTAIAIGPAWDSEFTGLTDSLQLYR